MTYSNPSIFFTAPGVVQIVDQQVPEPKPGEVLIRARKTLISTGTELTLLHARTRRGSAWDGITEFPQPVGYSHVGEVVGVGEGVASDWLGRRVDTHSFHAAYVTCAADQLRELPATVSDEDATFTTLAEVVMNGLRRARLRWGESIAVFGLGILGQLCVRIASVAGAGPIFGLELSDFRRGKLPRAPWIHCFDGANVQTGSPSPLRAAVEERNRGRRVDLVVELTASPELIPAEFELLRDQGRFLVLSSPSGASDFDFHDLCNRRSLTIIGAHGFSHPRVETPDHPWTGKRHGDLFLEWLAAGRVTVSEMISHRFPMNDAAHAYQLLSERRNQALGVIIEWD
jgi:threonine dehydrogenase-like Zn-dependent dehydrogenase